MTQHTPGPWELREPLPDMRGPERDTGDKIVVSANQLVPAIVYEFGAEGEANARLIAAAPEMLAALRAAEEWLSGWASAEPYIDVIRDAIAKATTGRPWIKAAPIVPRTIAG